MFSAVSTFSPFRLFTDEITIAGSKIVLTSFGRAVEMFGAGAIDHRALISHSFTLDEDEKAFEMFRSGGGRKIQIRPNDSVSREFIQAPQSLLGDAPRAVVGYALFQKYPTWMLVFEGGSEGPLALPKLRRWHGFRS